MQDDEVRFSLFNVMRHSVVSDACFMIKVVEDIVPNHSGLTDLWRLALCRMLRKN